MQLNCMLTALVLSALPISPASAVDVRVTITKPIGPDGYRFFATDRVGPQRLGRSVQLGKRRKSRRRECRGVG